MNNNIGSVLADDAALRFPSLASMRAAHGRLLKFHRERGDQPEFLAEAERFILRGQATGALLTDNDRWTGQCMLDYWATTLYRSGREVADSAMDEFNPELAPELDQSQCPYLGLDAFREDTHKLFFGRRHLIGDLIKKLETDRFLAVVGPSGSGKSSLTLGGLLPALKTGALPSSQNWHYFPPLTPGADPLANLARLVMPVGLAQAEQAEWMDRQVASLRQQPDHFARLCAAIGDQPVVLTMDQFEEVFTLCDDGPARQAFIANLFGLISASAPRHTLIITMRSDYEAYVARLDKLQPSFARIFFERAQARVTPLNAAELREAIEKPAEMVGLKFEPGVVEALIQDILGEPAGLPLLQFTLLKLWDRRERNRVTLEAYRRLGGGRLALARSADAFYEGLLPEEQVTCKRILLRMVRPSEGLEITSNRIRREALYRGGEDPGRVDRVLDKLVRARLVRLTQGETPADAQVEVAHEALVRNWPRLVDWLEEERAAIIARRRLEAKAAEWVRLGKGDSGLLDEVQLREAERWLASAEAETLGYDESLTALARASRSAIEAAAREKETAQQRELEQARRLAEAERQRAEEQQRRVREQAKATARLYRLVMALAIASLLALGAAVSARMQRGKALEAQREAHATAELARHNEEEAKRARREAEQARREAIDLGQRETERAAELDQARAQALIAQREAEAQAHLAADRQQEEVRKGEANKLARDAGILAQSKEYQKAIDKYHEAIPLYQQAGDREGEVAAITEIAEAHVKLGKRDEAEGYYQRALKTQEMAAGKESPKVAASLNTLAEFYRNQGRHAEAELLFLRALEIYKKNPDTEGPNIAISLNTLATIYRLQGRSAKAEELYNEVLKIYEQTFGSESASMASGLSGLANFYRTQGRYAEAEPLYQRAMNIYQKTAGPNSPNLIPILNTLAASHRGQGRYGEAEQLYQRALTVQEKASGKESVSLIGILNGLAETYRDQGKYAEAEPLYRRALAIQEKASGPENTNVIGNLNALATFYRHQNKYAQAEPLYQRALAINEKAWGAETTNVANSLGALAALYRDWEKYDRAESHYKQALAIQEKILGANHPTVAGILENYAILLRKTNREEEAAKIEARIKGIRTGIRTR